MTSRISPKVAQLEQALASKPSVEQITNRLAHPIRQIMQRVEQIERDVAASTRHSSISAAAPVPAAAPNRT